MALTEATYTLQFADPVYPVHPGKSMIYHEKKHTKRTKSSQTHSDFPMPSIQLVVGSSGSTYGNRKYVRESLRLDLLCYIGFGYVTSLCFNSTLNSDGITLNICILCLDLSIWFAILILAMFMITWCAIIELLPLTQPAIREFVAPFKFFNTSKHIKAH